MTISEGLYQDLLNKWKDLCNQGVDLTTKNIRRSELLFETEYIASDLLAISRYLAGVACNRCQGHGQRTYGSTASWRGGIGGQSITTDVCDKCWGTGRTDRTGINLRKLATTFREPDSWKDFPVPDFNEEEPRDE